MHFRPPNQAEQELKEQIWQQAEADRGQLLLHQPFVGALIMRMDIVPVCDSRLNTAATDGSSIFLDCHYYAKLDSDERLFLLAHEVWHCAFLHFARRQGRTLKRWNVAADLEIQFTLEKEQMKNPSPLPHLKEWKDLNAEEIYQQLKQMPVAERKEFGDVHLEENDSLGGGEEQFAKTKKTKVSRKKSSSPGQPKQPDQADCDSLKSGEDEPDGVSLSTGADDSACADNSFVMDPDYAPFFVSDIVERTRTRVVSATRLVERMRGTVPRGLERLLGELLDAKLPWQELLAQFVTTCYGGTRRWLPPSRRHVASGLYLPSLRSQKLKAVVAIDTSGSTINFLPGFFAEISSLLATFGDYELTVIQCDAAIHEVKQYNNYDPIPADHQWRAKGYGGTDFRPVFRYLEKHPETDHSLLIFFTDGHGPAVKEPPPYPVLWLICGKGNAPVPWGTAIKI